MEIPKGNVNMKLEQPYSQSKALVIVFEDLPTATSIVDKLALAGLPLGQVELVTRHVVEDVPEIESPAVHDTTGSTMVENSFKWGGVGVGTGIVAGLLTPFPGLVLGMAIMGGVTGAIMGGMAGVDEAIADDSVNLPTLEEYEQLVQNGHCLVVVRGSQEDIARAEVIVREYPDIHSHLHALHGHEFHEHPASE
jgi:hypothetical protein